MKINTSSRNIRATLESIVERSGGRLTMRGNIEDIPSGEMSTHFLICQAVSCAIFMNAQRDTERLVKIEG